MLNWQYVGCSRKKNQDIKDKGKIRKRKQQVYVKLQNFNFGLMFLKNKTLCVEMACDPVPLSKLMKLFITKFEPKKEM